jgi:hypothetical protein
MTRPTMLKTGLMRTDGVLVGNGLKQGDGLASNLRKMALEYVIKTAGSRSQIHNILQISAVNRIRR